MKNTSKKVTKYIVGLVLVVVILGTGGYFVVSSIMSTASSNSQEAGAASTSSALSTAFPNNLFQYFIKLISPNPYPNPSGGSGAVKSQIRGLIDMGDVSFRISDTVPNNSIADLYTRPGVFGGVVINATWSELEPTQGTFVTTQIDQALAAVHAYNAKYPQTPLGVRLRVAEGNDAPDWVKNMGGSPITMYQGGGRTGDVNTSKKITVGRFWTEPYENAWTQLQTALAQKYDSNPLVHEVANSSCSSATDEPFIIPEDSTSLKDLHAAGFTDAAYQQCLMNSISQYQGWKTTLVEFPFNGFRVSDSGTVTQNPAITIQIMDAFRNQLGARAILANHSLIAPGENDKTGENLLPVYTEMKRLGAPISFQIEGPHEDWAAAITYGISFGADAVEAWDSANGEKFTAFNQATLQQWSQSILGNSK